MFRDLTTSLNRRQGVAVALAALGIAGGAQEQARGKKRKKWVKCTPGSVVAKCPKKYPSCCAPDSMGDCCPKDYPMCCPVGSKADCCSGSFPYCCPAGSLHGCSATADLSGCNASMGMGADEGAGSR